MAIAPSRPRAGRRLLPAAVAAAVVLAVSGCGAAEDERSQAPQDAAPASTSGGDGVASASTARASGGAPLRTVSTGLAAPWGVAFLPSGEALVAERDTARIRRVAKGGGTARSVGKVPGVVPGGEGGLLGLAVSPRYAEDRLVYAYLTSARDNRIVRFRVTGSGIGSVRTVLTGLRKAPIHNGGRIAFGPDGKLYATVGDAGNTASAQDRSSMNGKILRMDPDGGVPASGNPFSGSRVYSLGHRNPQGIAWDRRGRLWAAEFGQSAYDELNLIRAGRNYGWPTVEGRGSTAGGRFTNPVAQWSTSEASPSGIAIVGERLYMAALGGESLIRLRLSGTSARKLPTLYRGRYGRIRTAVRAPDGRLWFTTSNRDGRGDVRSGDDRILRLRVPR